MPPNSSMCIIQQQLNNIIKSFSKIVWHDGIVIVFFNVPSCRMVHDDVLLQILHDKTEFEQLFMFVASSESTSDWQYI